LNLQREEINDARRWSKVNCGGNSKNAKSALESNAGGGGQKGGRDGLPPGGDNLAIAYCEGNN